MHPDAGALALSSIFFKFWRVFGRLGARPAAAIVGRGKHGGRSEENKGEK